MLLYDEENIFYSILSILFYYNSNKQNLGNKTLRKQIFMQAETLKTTMSTAKPE